MLFSTPKIIFQIKSVFILGSESFRLYRYSVILTASCYYSYLFYLYFIYSIILSIWLSYCVQGSDKIHRSFLSTIDKMVEIH